MSDSSAKTVSQKSNSSGGNETNSAFADAVQRARQLAAKIHSGSEPVTSGTKRPLEDNMNDGTPDMKKMAGDPFSQMPGMPQRNGGDMIVVEETQVPDKMVGLIIGRGGEQIIRLQSESGCKIQLATECTGLPERSCTLTGTRQSIEIARQMIDQIISKANSPFPPEPGHGGGGGGGGGDGQYVAEMMIPGGKVGLLIGKGGENIRNLQERGGVKMVLIQDGPQQTSYEKPLRISGDPQKVEFAKQMVMDLLAQKEMDRGFLNGGQHTQDEILVPRPAVGVVIGKGGDMIKRIQQDSGARIQFIQGKEDVPGDKMCQLTGNMDQVQKASAIIRDLIQSVMMGGGPGPMGGGGGPMGRGRGRGRGGGPMGGRPDFGGGRGGPPPMGRGGPMDGGNEMQLPVPANKCGLVIGKGGETVKSINQQSGAHVEIARNSPQNAPEKIFTIRGNPGQIEHAKQLIFEKIGGMPSGPGGPPGGGGGGGGGPNQGAPGQYGGQYPQQFQQQQPQAQPYGAPSWPAAPAAPQGYQTWNQPAAQPAVASDPNKAAQDQSAAAWAAYYAQQYYQQGAAAATQPQAQGVPAQMTQSAAASAAAATTPQAQPAAAGGQTDYSAAWVEYYRSLGMYREAELIEQQARVTGGGQPGATSAGAQSAAAPAQSSQGAAGAQPAGASAYPGAYAAAPGQQAAAAYGQPAAPYSGYSYAAPYGTPQ